MLWLIKDTCWVLDLKIPGLIMILPTIAVAIYLTWKHRALNSELFHNIAVVSWLCANSIWMIGEFFFNDTLRPIAIVFFAIGVIVVLSYYIFIRPKEKRVGLVATGFRLRLPDKRIHPTQRKSPENWSFATEGFGLPTRLRLF
ncbi:MAG: hypothetical protein IPM91_15730 [Bacteroidetes bacterium]|nr:hypothetical protein [Bacteroidota bacterium]